MTPESAFQILGLTPDATEAERFATYEDTRVRLEGKLAKAPTPGLKEKYRESLRQMEQAIEVIEGSADGGDLPTLSPQTEQRPDPTPQTAPPEIDTPPRQAAGRKSIPTEMGIMGAVVIVILAAGGWYMYGQASLKAEQAAIDSFMLNVARGRTDDVSLALHSSLPLDLDQTNEKGDTALYVATEKGHVEIVKQLLADPGVTVYPLNAEGLPATSSRNTAPAVALLSKNLGLLDAYLQSARSEIDRNDLLVFASSQDYSDGDYGDAARLLLSHPDVDVNYVDTGTTPLIRASSRGQAEIVRILLAHPGIDIEYANEYLGTALTAATSMGHQQIVRMLRDAGAKSQDCPYTPLHPDYDRVCGHSGARK